MAQTAEQQAITLVLDPDEDLTTLRALRSLHARPFGQIVCEPPTSGAADLAHHLVAALGRSADEPDGAGAALGLYYAPSRSITSCCCEPRCSATPR